MIDFTNLEEIFRNNNSFLITSHVNPDADAIGSEIAVYLILKELGKTVFVVNHSKTPYNLQFLDIDNIIEKYDPEKHSYLFEVVDVLIALDFNNPKRIVSMEKGFMNSSKIKICIDHHQNPANFVDYEYIDVSYAATSHLIFEFIITTNIVELTMEIAESLYAAIMTDTGSFRFDRTTPEIHRIAAELIETGVNPVEIYDKIYDQSNFGKIQLLGECLSTIRLNESKEIAYILVTQDALNRTGADEDEVDGFVNFCLSIQGVKIGMLFFELNDGIKVSFRSKGIIPINLLAEEFGGGGHTNAAGTRIYNVALNGTVEKIVETAEKYLNIFEA